MTGDHIAQGRVRLKPDLTAQTTSLHSALLNTSASNGTSQSSSALVNAAGMWARQLGERSGVAIPLQAAEHYTTVCRAGVREGCENLASVYEHTGDEALPEQMASICASVASSPMTCSSRHRRWLPSG